MASPVFTGLNGNPTFVEDSGTPIVLDSDVTISDAELDALDGGDGNYGGATLTISRDGGADANDVFSFEDFGVITLNGNSLEFSGEHFATFTSSGGTLTIAFTDTNFEVSTSIVDIVLQNISYSNPSDDPGASATLTWTFDDGSSDPAAVGSTVVDFTEINDEPTILAPAFGGTVFGNGDARKIYAGADLDPIEAEDFASVTITVSGLADGADERFLIDGSDLDLSQNSGPADLANVQVTIANGGATATITITGLGGGTVTQGDLETVLGNLEYQNTNADPTTGDRVFAITTLQDEGGTANGGDNTWNGSLESTLTVEEGELPTTTDATKSATEDTAFTFTTDEFVFAEEAIGNDAVEYITIQTISGGTLELVGTLSNTDATATDATGLENALGAVTAGNSIHIDNIANLQYTPPADSNTDQTITYSVTDAGGDTSTPNATITIELDAVNDDPTETGAVPVDIAIDEDTVGDVDLSGLTLADVDGDTGVVLTLTVGRGDLTATSGGGVTVGGSGTSTLTLTGTASAIDTYLNTASNIQYETTVENANGDNYTTLDIDINDNAGSGNIDLNATNTNIDIDAVNDEPTLTATGSDANAYGGHTAVSVFSGASLDAIESGQDFTELVFTVSGVQTADDEVINLDGTAIDITATNGPTDTAGGKYQYDVSFAGDTATVIITADGGAAATESELESVLNGITYQNNTVLVTTGDRVITVTSVTDDGGTPNGGSDVWSDADIVSTISVLDGDTPIASDVTTQGTEDTPLTLNTNLIAVEDEVNGVDEIEYITIFQITGGTLELTGTPVTTAATDAAVLVSTAGPVVAGNRVHVDNISRLVFTPDADSTSDGTIRYRVTDSASDTTPSSNTLTIEFSDANDSPTGTDATVNSSVGNSYAFDESDFGFGDTDAGDTLGSVRIASQTLDNGTLFFNGSAVSNNTTIPVDELDQLVYTPFASGSDEFTFYVIDDGGLSSEDANTITVTSTGSVGSLQDDPTSSLPEALTTATSGDDVLQLGASDDFIALGAGDDTIHAGDGDDAVFAGSGDTGDDLLEGGRGDDTLGGGAGNDTVYGGDGFDLIFGGAGSDVLHGDHPTSPSGDVSANSIWAGAGNDVATGGSGNDTLGGGDGNDLLSGGIGADIFYGGRDSGNDTINGGNSNDTVFSSAGDDKVDGGAADDLLFSGGGSDTVTGGSGDDTIWAGGGDDTFTGGAGADVFAFTLTGGNDTITDFDESEDSLDFRGTNFTSLADVQAAATNSGGNLVITIDTGTTVTLEGLAVSDLGDITFVFE